jgi:phospholipase/lecithinase/hemolysin
MILDAIALDRTALSAFAVAELKTSYNSTALFTGSESGGLTAGQQELYIQNGAVTVRSGTDTRTSNVAEPRASKATVGYVFGPSTSYVYNKESWRGQGVALASSTIGRLTLGKSVFGGSAFNGMYALFGMAIYGQTLSNTTTGPAVVSALNTACEVPTAFQYTAVFNGDSILEGSGAARLLNTVRQMALRKEGEVINSAIHGTTLATQYAARTRFTTNVYNAARPCVFFMQAGTNDLVTTTGATLYANTATPYVTYLKGLGYKVVICTVLPRTGSSGWNASMEAERLAYNSLVVSNGAGADLVLDLASDSVMGPTTACADTSLYGDSLHPATAGHARLATLYRAALQVVLRTTSLGGSYVP